MVGVTYSMVLQQLNVGAVHLLRPLLASCPINAFLYHLHIAWALDYLHDSPQKPKLSHFAFIGILTPKVRKHLEKLIKILDVVHREVVAVLLGLLVLLLAVLLRHLEDANLHPEVVEVLVLAHDRICRVSALKFECFKLN